MLKLSVIIVNYRSAEQVESLLESLKRSDLSQIPHEIIVVNNDASEQSQLQELFQKIDSDTTSYVLIGTTHNIGFGAASNLGAKKATGQHLLFLNPDTLYRSGSFQEFLQDAAIGGIVGAALYTPTGTVEPWSYGSTPTLWQILSNHTWGWDHVQKSFNKKHLGYVSGGALSIARENFERLDGFDERYFLYFEDVDLCTRARALGLTVILSPKLTLTHAGGVSQNSHQEQKRHYYRSQLQYFRDHRHSFEYHLLRLAAIARRAILGV
jgi:N-acetylglucosaminyl-diphospho-decaprenol L-rhamnosyltransferase